MPKGKGKKKKKGAEEPVEVLARDFGTEFEPVDGMGGEVGLEHLEFTRKVETVAARIAEKCVLEGDPSVVSLDGLRCHELPSVLFEDEELAEVVTELSARDNLLVGSAVTALVALGSLRKLDLSANFLVGEAPAALGELGKLEELVLGDNKVTALPETWANLVSLRKLVAPRNDLVTLSPVVAGAWPGLRVLDLRGNKLTAIPDELFTSAAASLREVQLGSNALEELPASVGGLRGLEVLDVSRNKLTSLPDGLASCTRLRSLSAHANAIAALPAALFAGMSALQRLHLHDNKLAELPASVGGCTSLRVVTLSNNALKALPEELGACTEMSEFYCNGNGGLTGLPASVKGWRAPTAVSFKGCKLKGFPEPEADIAEAWAPSLKHLDVTSKGKKPSCKLPREEFVDRLYQTTVVGAAEKKVKKGKKGKGKGK